MRFLAVLLGVATSAFIYTTCHAAPMLDAPDIGNFDHRQFVDPAQAGTLGKDLSDILGYIAVEGQDHSLTITSCRKIIGSDLVSPTPDLGQPVFDDIVDSDFSSKFLLSFLNVDVSNSKKVEVSATDEAEATLPQDNIPKNLSAPIAECSLPQHASLYYIQKATLTLVTKTTYVKTEGSGGILSFISVDGVKYSRSEMSNMYTVSVFAVPIYYTTAFKLVIPKTEKQLEQLPSFYQALGILPGSADLKTTSMTLAPAKFSAGFLGKLDASIASKEAVVNDMSKPF